MYPLWKLGRYSDMQKPHTACEMRHKPHHTAVHVWHRSWPPPGHITFNSRRRFATGKGVQSLTNILKAYAAMDPEVGYCQGMNFLAGVLLTYLPSEADAYGALVLLMKERHLRELYKQDLAWLQVRADLRRHPHLSSA